MRILGIDPGLQVAGWGVAELADSRLLHIASGELKPKKTKPLAERLAYLSKKTEALVQRWKPDGVALETVFVSRNPMVALRLGEARGVFLAACAPVPLEEYAPATIKKTVTGNARAEKIQVATMVGLLLGRPPPESEHVADALAVAITHTHHATSLLSQVEVGR